MPNAEEMIERTLHRTTWGLANASGHLGRAIAALKDARILMEEGS
jgi:hypothetical protein